VAAILAAAVTTALALVTAPARARAAEEATFDAVTNPAAAKSVPATYRDSLDYVGSLRRAEVGPVQLVHYDGGTIPSDHYPVRAEIHY
jgi:endonuclease/exonuclease/phosphatase family metal-dependent hydrolase